MLKSTAAKPVKLFQLLLNQEQNDPLTAYEKQKKKKVPVKLCNELSQKEDRIMNSTAIKFIKQHFQPTLTSLQLSMEVNEKV